MHSYLCFWAFKKISADTFRSIESERINKRDSLLSIITGAKNFRQYN